jgi:hypothetical protein
MKLGCMFFECLSRAGNTDPAMCRRDGNVDIAVVGVAVVQKLLRQGGTNSLSDA